MMNGKQRGSLKTLQSDLKSLEKLAEELGLSTDSKFAQTGTVYLTVENAKGRSLVIRVADHADAYGRADYTCDNCEGTLAGAKLQLLELRGTTQAALRRVRRLRKNHAKRDLSERKRTWVEAMVAAGHETREEAERQADILFGK